MLTEEQLDKINIATDDRKCPKCGRELDCHFHERDFTSWSMYCKCGWYAFVRVNGEWEADENF